LPFLSAVGKVESRACFAGERSVSIAANHPVASPESLGLQITNDIFLRLVESDREQAILHQDAGGFWQPLSAREVYARVRSLANAFLTWNIAKGDRIAILAENRWEWAVTDFAALAIGAVDVPIYPTLTGEQVAALIVPAYARGQSRRTVHDQLQAHFAKVGATLNPHKRIRILRFTDSDLPRTRTRKLKRAEVAELLGRMIAQSTEDRHGEVDVEPWLVETLSQVTADGTRICSATRLIEDLGLDSLALAELGEHVAARTGREMTPEELGNLRTVEDLQQAIAHNAAANALTTAISSQGYRRATRHARGVDGETLRHRPRARGHRQGGADPRRRRRPPRPHRRTALSRNPGVAHL